MRLSQKESPEWRETKLQSMPAETLPSKVSRLLRGRSIFTSVVSSQNISAQRVREKKSLELRCFLNKITIYLKGLYDFMHRNNVLLYLLKI